MSLLVSANLSSYLHKTKPAQTFFFHFCLEYGTTTFHIKTSQLSFESTVKEGEMTPFFKLSYAIFPQQQLLSCKK